MDKFTYKALLEAAKNPTRPIASVRTELYNLLDSGGHSLEKAHIANALYSNLRGTRISRAKLSKFKILIELAIMGNIETEDKDLLRAVIETSNVVLLTRLSPEHIAILHNLNIAKEALNNLRISIIVNRDNLITGLLPRPLVYSVCMNELLDLIPSDALIIGCITKVQNSRPIEKDIETLKYIISRLEK